MLKSSLIAASLPATLLMSCAQSGLSSRPSLPVLSELPESISGRCEMPDIADGDDALGIIADHRFALADCRDKHDAMVDLYNSARSLSAGAK